MEAALAAFFLNRDFKGFLALRRAFTDVLGESLVIGRIESPDGKFWSFESVEVQAVTPTTTKKTVAATATNLDDLRIPEPLCADLPPR